MIKYFENIFSAFNEAALLQIFSFMPEWLQHACASFTGLFVGEGWHLTLGALFMLTVIFLPGGLMEGLNRIYARLRPRRDHDSDRNAPADGNTLRGETPTE